MRYRKFVINPIIVLSFLIVLTALLMIVMVPQVSQADESEKTEVIDLDEPFVIPEGHEDDVYKNIDFVSITSEERGKDFILELKNEGNYTVYDWSVAFNASFKALDITGAELVTADQVLRFRNEEYFDALAPGETREVCIETDSDNHDVQFYRVYGVCDELSDEFIDSDYVQFIDEDGSVTLKTADDGEDIYSERQLSCFEETEAEYDINAVDSVGSDIGTYAIIGNNDSRTLVSNVNAGRYRSIANIRSTWDTETEIIRRFGTGFMIGPRHMLTSAHNVFVYEYGGRCSGTIVHFGQNGQSFSKYAIPIARNITSSYMSRPAIANDRACLIFKKQQYRGFFKLGYTRSFRLKSIRMYVTGYPGDKSVKNPNNPRWPKYYMYTASGRINYASNGILKYRIDTTEGESGAPVYSINGTVYGIHSRPISGQTKYNAAAYITPSLANRYKRMGWAG